MLPAPTDSTPPATNATCTSMDEHFMQQALACARAAADCGEVPVGAVIVHNGHIIARDHNATLSARDPSAHAEILALRAAAAALGNHRLTDCTLYVTLEPCAMCAGAILHARLRRVVFAAADPRTGAAGSVLNLFGDRRLNHQTQVSAGVLAEPCAALLKHFFAQRRQQQQQTATPLRSDALRTPPECFCDLPPSPPGITSSFTAALPSLGGLRMHWLMGTAPQTTATPAPTWVCLHGELGWGAQFHALLDELLHHHQGNVLALDLPGFGWSDKPKRTTAHFPQWHLQILHEWLAMTTMQASRIILVAHGAAAALALQLLCDAEAEDIGNALHGRIDGLLLLNPWFAWQGEAALQWRQKCMRTHAGPTPALLRAGGTPPDARTLELLRAPFPDRGHCAALRAFALADDAPAPTAIPTAWRGKTLIITGDGDAICPPALARRTAQTLQGDAAVHILPDAGRWPDAAHSAAIARHAVEYFADPDNERT